MVLGVELTPFVFVAAGIGGCSGIVSGSGTVGGSSDMTAAGHCTLAGSPGPGSCSDSCSGSCFGSCSDILAGDILAEGSLVEGSLAEGSLVEGILAGSSWIERRHNFEGLVGHKPFVSSLLDIIENTHNIFELVDTRPIIFLGYQIPLLVRIFIRVLYIDPKSSFCNLCLDSYF